MVNRERDIAPVGFNSSIHPRLPVEVDGCAELLGRVSERHVSGPQRPSFDFVMLLRSDRGSHEIDFEPVEARAGRMVRLRSGQVQAWRPDPPLDGRIVMSGPGTSTPQPWFSGDPVVADLPPAAAATASSLIDELERQQATFAADDATVRLMIALFDALTALFDQHVDRFSSAALPPVYVAFRTAIEREPSAGRDVATYARRIGYSPRTVTRACLEATGQTAKQILVDGVTLRAKRRLARTADPIAEIARDLGFSEATNFTKFFAREVGVTPLEFRRTQRG